MAFLVEKLIFGGQGLAHDNGTPIFLWNALPGETVEYEILKKRKGIIEAVATKIISASPDRIAPRETHYLCCSPWQIITPAGENQWKQTIALETYRKIGGLNIAPEDCPIISGAENFGYRNKIEFSFTNDANGQPTLAFFNRGQHSLIALPNGCALAHPNLNRVGQAIVDWVRSEGWTTYNLKSAIIRANSAGVVSAVVFIKDQLAPKKLPVRESGWQGLELYYSDHRCPASRPDKLLARDGNTTLTEKIYPAPQLAGGISGLNFSFGPFSFFQINVPVFERALADIQTHVAPDASILDYYSGVGAIGLSLAKEGRGACPVPVRLGGLGGVKLIEINAEAHEYALKNIAQNKIKNAEAILSPAEKVLDFITPESTVIVDPPRAGLHPDFIKQLLSVVPEKIIYLSCDVATQARDLKLLAEKYYPTFHRLYNFFPRTPHLEALTVLEKL